MPDVERTRPPTTQVGVDVQPMQPLSEEQVPSLGVIEAVVERELHAEDEARLVTKARRLRSASVLLLTSAAIILVGGILRVTG